MTNRLSGAFMRTTIAAVGAAAPALALSFSLAGCRNNVQKPGSLSPPRASAPPLSTQSSGQDDGQWPMRPKTYSSQRFSVPAGIVITVLGLALFAAWIGESERRVAYSQSERIARTFAGAKAPACKDASGHAPSTAPRPPSPRPAGARGSGEGSPKLADNMPDMNVSDRDGRDMAAYLYTLR